MARTHGVTSRPLGHERLGTTLRTVRHFDSSVAALAFPNEPEGALEIRKAVPAVRTSVDVLCSIRRIPWHTYTCFAAYKNLGEEAAVVTFPDILSHGVNPSHPDS